MKRTALIVLVLSCIAQTTQTKKKIRDVSGSANKPPVILKFESSAAVVHTCEPAVCLSTSRQTVSLRVGASDPEGDALTYKYSANAGEIFGQGASVSWRLGDERPGTYSVTANVTDSKGAEAFATLQIAVSGCASCRMPGPEPARL